MLEEVSEKLGERMSKSVRVSLRKDLGQLLLDNQYTYHLLSVHYLQAKHLSPISCREQFQKKFTGAMTRIEKAVERSTEDILRQVCIVFYTLSFFLDV